LIVHHATKHGRSTGGLSLRGSGDFFAWVDTALSLRRRQHVLVLSAEHRAAAAPDPVTLTRVGAESDMHLALVAGDAPLDPSAPVPAVDLDAAILRTLDRVGADGLSRMSLRAAMHVRNERIGDALARLAAAGQITRCGELWVRVPSPTLTDGHGNGNAARTDPSGVV
jgi:hypothetical protein